MTAGDAPLPRVPAIDGDFWRIGTCPELPEFAYAGRDGAREHEVVDHAIFRSADGAWHLWACVRGLRIGRLLYHWEGESLEKGP